MIAVLLDQNISLDDLLKGYDIVSKVVKHNYQVYIVNVNGTNVLFANFGHTKVQVSTLVAELMSQYPITSVIQAGNCASINAISMIHDVAISNKVLQYDVDYQSLGYGKNVIPIVNQSSFNANPDLIAVASASAGKLGNESSSGTFAGADRFLANTLAAKQLNAVDGIDFIDSESGSIGELAFLYKIPFVSVKGVSNYANAQATADYMLHEKSANNKSSLVALDMVDTLTRSPLTDQCYQFRTLSVLEVENVLNANNTLMLSMANSNLPYALPMFYTYATVNAQRYIFMLSNSTGRKISALALNRQVCAVIQQNIAGSTGQGDYYSVVCFGTAMVFNLTQTSTDTVVNRFTTSQRPRVSAAITRLVSFPQVCGATTTLIVLPITSLTGRFYYLSETS